MFCIFGFHFVPCHHPSALAYISSSRRVGSAVMFLGVVISLACKEGISHLQFALLEASSKIS
jgi:hypothetical protein